MKKVLSLLLAAAMLLSALTACGPKTSPGSTTPPAGSTGAVQPTGDGSQDVPLEGEITFWHSFTQGARLETIQAAADAFMDDNPGVTINIETFSWADFYTKWTTGLNSGNVPDMSSALSTQVVEMIDAGAILPVDSLVDDIGRDRFYQNAITEMTAEDGCCYGVPLYSNTQALWYRTDLLAKYNLPVPATWEELYEAAKTITDGEGGNAYGLAMPTGTNDMMATLWLHLYVRSAGETLLTEDGKANLSSQTALDGINYWLKIYNECSPKDAINYNASDESTIFYQGKLAFDFNTGFQISGVEANAPELLDKLGCAAIPRVNKSDPETGCLTTNIPVVIWKNSKHPEICEAFIKYLYDPDRYVEFLLSVPVGMMPALKGVTENETYQANEIVQNFQDANEVLYQMLGGSTSIGMEYGPKAEAGLLTSQRVIEGMFQDIIINGTDVEAAAAAAEAKLNELFETVS